MRAADLSSDRRTRLVPVPGRAQVEALVPPPCPRNLDTGPVLAALLAAERAIAQTATVARLLPEPDLITRSLERREAVLSSQIEGTRTDLAQLLEYEATRSDKGPPGDAAVTLGYVRALDHGLRAVRREGGPRHLTLDLIRQLHRVLMAGSDYRHPEGAGARRIEDATLVATPRRFSGRGQPFAVRWPSRALRRAPTSSPRWRPRPPGAAGRRACHHGHHGHRGRRRRPAAGRCARPSRRRPWIGPAVIGGHPLATAHIYVVHAKRSAVPPSARALCVVAWIDWLWPGDRDGLRMIARAGAQVDARVARPGC